MFTPDKSTVHRAFSRRHKTELARVFKALVFGKRLFISSTFGQMGRARDLVVNELGAHPDLAIYLPHRTETDPFKMYEDITQSVNRSSIFLILLGSSSGTVWRFVDSKTTDLANLVRLVVGEKAQRQEPDHIMSGESFTQVEARFLRKAHYVVVFVQKTWLENLPERRKYWEAKGIYFHVPHLLVDSCKDGACWDPPKEYDGICRVYYYIDLQRSRRRTSLEDENPTSVYAGLTDSEWQEISWIQFSLDVLRSGDFYKEAFETFDELPEKARRIVAQILRRMRVIGLALLLLYVMTPTFVLISVVLYIVLMAGE